MFARFKDLYASEKSFQPFTKLLREFIGHRWPSREERLVLGNPFAASGHLPSQDVARSIRRHPSYVRNATEALLEKSSSHERHVGAWLSEGEIAAVLSDAQGLVSGREMMALLGVQKHEWDALRAGGFIHPRIKSDKMRKVWHPDDAAGLLDMLRGANPKPWDASPYWRRIAPGAAAAKLPYDLVLKAIIAGEIWTSVDESKTGLLGIFIRRECLVQMFNKLTESQSSKQDRGRGGE